MTENSFFLFYLGKIVYLCASPFSNRQRRMTQKDYISRLSSHLFWDMDQESVDMDTCPSQIIQRVLEYGTLDDWKLILSYYGLNKIVTVCRSLRTLDAKALSFICCISGTDKTQYRCYYITQSNPTRWNF